MSTTATVRAIIVDSSALMRATLSNLLHSANIEVAGQLPDGKRLLDAIDRLRPQIICLAYQLPGVNGLALLQSVVAAHPHIPVVILSEEQDPQLQSAADQAGAAGFIAKPFSQDQVLRVVQDIIQARHFLAHQPQHLAPTNTLANPNKLAEQKTALIADDSKTMRELLTAILSSLNINVLAQAHNGAQAVELAAQHQPDLICLDVDMPIMNGLDALRAIRQKNASAKVMMITGNAHRETVVGATQQGIVGFIVKPFDPLKVSAAVTKVVGS